MKRTRFTLAVVTCALGESLLAQAGATRSAPANVLDNFSDAVQQLVKQAAPAVLQVVTEGFGGANAESAEIPTSSRAKPE